MMPFAFRSFDRVNSWLAACIANTWLRRSRSGVSSTPARSQTIGYRSAINDCARQEQGQCRSTRFPHTRQPGLQGVAETSWREQAEYEKSKTREWRAHI